jgi:integrase
VERARFVREPRKLPVVPSPEEVARLLDATPSLKYKAALSVAYGAGLRVSEVVALKVGDIDSRRTVIRIEQGKGRKDRYVRCLRICSNRCVPGRGPHDRRAGCLLGAVQPMTTRQLNRASMPPPVWPRSASRFPCIRCGTMSPS